MPPLTEVNKPGSPRLRTPNRVTLTRSYRGFDVRVEGLTGVETADLYLQIVKRIPSILRAEEALYRTSRTDK